MRYTFILFIVAFLISPAGAEDDFGTQNISNPETTSSNQTSEEFKDLTTLTYNPISRLYPSTVSPYVSIDLDCPSTHSSLAFSLNKITGNSCYDKGKIEKDPYEKQIATCECLNESSPLSFSAKTNLFKKNDLNTNDYSLEHLREVLSELDSKTVIRNNALILQAHILGENVSKKYGFNSEQLSNKNYAENYKKTLVETLNKQLVPTEKEKETFKSNVNKILEEIPQRANVLDILSKNDVEGEKCIPFKNFLVAKSYPESDSFWEAVKKDFEPSSWNIENLEKEFLDLNKSGETRLQAEAKIEFLEKNPLVKYAFLSRDQIVSKKVYDVMKKHMANLPNNCDSEFKGCFKAFQDKGLKNYLKDIAAVMEDEDVKKAVEQGREIENLKLMQNLASKSQSKYNIASLSSYSSKEFNIDPSQCIDLLGYNYLEGYTAHIRMMFSDKSDKELKELEEACTRRMPKYCQFAHKSPTESILRDGSTNNKIKNKEDDSQLTQLYNEIALDMVPDVKENVSFSSDSELYCKNHYRIADGKSQNLEDYKKATCKKEPTKISCTDKIAMLKEFYSLPEDKNKNIKNSSEIEYGDVSVNAIAQTGTVRVMQESEVQQYSGLNTLTSWLKKDSNSTSSTANISSSSGNNPLLTNLNETNSTIQGSTGAAASIAPSSQLNSFQFAASQLREQKDEIDKEIKDTKAAIEYNSERLSRPNISPEFKSDVEVRIASLERLLAEKEKTSKEYQSLIDKLLNQSNDAERTELAQNGSAKKKIEEIPSEEMVQSRQTAKNNIAANQMKNDQLDENTRGPASVNESFTTAGAGNGGSSISAGAGSVASSFGAASAASARVNSALLSKYGISVQDSGDGNVQVAADKEQGQISPLLTGAKAQELGLEVTRSEFERFKKNDIGALTELYNEKLEMVNSNVVRLMIKTEGIQSPLEFYAIKEQGKVVFQPVRKNKLSDLKNALNQ